MAKPKSDFKGNDKFEVYTSPGYPRYGPNHFCIIEIKSRDPKECVEMEFTAFDVEDETNCRYEKSIIFIFLRLTLSSIGRGA